MQLADKGFAGVSMGQRMLIPTPLLIDEYIRQVPRGQSTTTEQIRKDLASRFRAEVTCPLTTGIFLRIVSSAHDRHCTRTCDQRSGQVLYRQSPDEINMRGGFN